MTPSNADRAPDEDRFVLRPHDVAAIMALIVIAWFATYLHFEDLGLVADDYGKSRFMTRSTTDVLESAASAVFSLPPTGRPLGHTTMVLGYGLGWNLGGLNGLFLLNAVIPLLNIVLMFAVVRRIASPATAIVAALIFALYPADTSKMLLIRGFHVQPALTPALVALLLYFSRWRWLSYPIAALPIFSYEYGAIPFLFAPFLNRNDDNRGRAILVHWAIQGALLSALVVLRASTMPGRLRHIGEFDIPALVQRVVEAIGIGTWSSAKSFATHPWFGIETIDAEGIALAAASGAASFVVLAMRNRAPHPESPTRWAWFVAGGLLMAAVPYALMIFDGRFPPDDSFGRTTSTHTGSAIGFAIVAAGMFSIIFQRCPGRPSRLLLMLAVSVYVGALVSFGTYTQRAHADLWQRQQALWTRLVALTQDLRDGDVIVLAISETRRSRFGRLVGWSGLAPRGLYRFPDSFDRPPFTVNENRVDKHLRQSGDGVVVRVRSRGVYQPLRPGRIIVIEGSETAPIRRTEPIDLAGVEIAPAASGPNRVSAYPPGPFYGPLILNERGLGGTD